MVKMRDLFAKDEILQKGRAAAIGSEGVLIVDNPVALIGCENGMAGAGNLVPFTAASPEGLRLPNRLIPFQLSVLACHCRDSFSWS